MNPQMKKNGQDPRLNIKHSAATRSDAACPVSRKRVCQCVGLIALTGFICEVTPLLAQKKVIVPKGAARSSSPYSPAIQTRDLTYVAGMVGRAPDGSVAKGEIRAQTRQVLVNIGAALDAAGLGFEHVVSTNVYLSDIRHLGAADEVYREYFPKDFPARTVLESMLMGPDFIVEISAIAVNDLAEKEVIQPQGWQPPKPPLSHAVRAGDTLFLSAFEPVDAKSGKLAAMTIREQTTQVMRNQEEALRAAGMGFGDLASSRIYLASTADYQGLNEAYKPFVKAVPPARATVNPRLNDPKHLIQIQSVAVKGSGENRPSGPGHTSPIHSYSVRAGDRLYITGMTGRGADGFARGDIKAQVRQSLKTIEEQLVKHGFTFADVVDSTVFLRDARDFQGMNEVYREIVRPNPPARATVRVPQVSGDSLVEIMMVASK